MISETFKQSFRKIIAELGEKESEHLANAIDNLKNILSIFTESFPKIAFEKPCEIPFRKAVISKNFIIIYLFQQGKVFLINLYSTAQNWKSKFMNE